jgi:demethylmenaquinone methyltransferase/2-methoxy-6-polyprenyl-1,4-benzoquinol methylase
MSKYRRGYIWFYDNIQSIYYDLLMKWCYLPFGGEFRIRNEMISEIEFFENEKILDMCSGTGGTTFTIARKATDSCHIIGMDISGGQLEKAIKKNDLKNVVFDQKDVRITGVISDHFDKVFIGHSLHEMNRKDRYEVLSESLRILKPDGLLVVLELDKPESLILRLFIWFWFFYWLPFNFETPTRKDMLKHGLEKEISETGYSNVKKISKYRGIMQVIVSKKPKIQI